MVNSVSKALEILKILADEVNRLTDISARLGYNISTTHRLLKTLEREGFVVQDPGSHQYFLGHVLLRLLSNPLNAHQGVVLSAQEEMKRLQILTGETIAIHIPLGDKRFCLEEVESSHRIKYTNGCGSVNEIYAGAGSKVLLSEYSEDQFQKLFQRIELKPAGPNTIMNKDVLLEELQRIKRDGFALSRGEGLDGAVAIAAPVKGYVCPVALSIMAPEFRFGEKILNYVDELKRSTGNIAKKLKVFGFGIIPDA